ncbi:transcription factor VBP-like [Daphnia pulex]|uniref:transcription factor VBP-like n=1 Tax=Daphnia pulex TaxID=6669 RepID=UPI001EDC9AA7|nr:transcription factor VBP-like [Daphnia pulex]
MMETKNSILNALLQQAIFNSQGVGANVPVNLSMSLNDERSEVTSSSSSADDESPADLSSRSHHQREDSPIPPSYQHHPDSSQLMHAMAAAFSFQRDLMAQQNKSDHLNQSDATSPASPADPSHLVAKALASATTRRPRSEKKPIPDDLKDGKYFERRRRNNLAAKRSRDMRKNREDQVTVRANFLEKENSVLRAQVATLRDEAFALKQMLLHKNASAILRSQAATS